jgi:hypothetical protein
MEATASVFGVGGAWLGVSGAGVRMGFPAWAMQRDAIPSIPRKTRTPRKEVKRLIFDAAVLIDALTKSSPIELYAQQLPNSCGRWPETCRGVGLRPEM